VGGTSGKPFIVKNHFELKNAQRVLFEDNLLENVWGGFSQNGYSVLLTPKNQNNHCPACMVKDVTMRYNQIKSVGNVLTIANALSDAGGASSGGERYSIHDLLVTDVHQADFGGVGLFALLDSTLPLLQNVRIEHVTAFTPRAVFSILDRREKMNNFSVTNNIFFAGELQIGNAGGGPQGCSFQADRQNPGGVLKNCFQNSTFTNNIFIDGSGWPKGNMTPKNLEAAGIHEIREPGAAAYQLCRGKDDPASCKKASPALGAATDGKDIGADVQAIHKIMTEVIAGTR
jgi:hypothetical protein